MNLRTLDIRLAEPVDRASWDAFALSNRDGLAYHLFAWKEAVEKAYGFHCPYFLAEKDGRVCGILPAARIHPPFRAGSLVSLPYCDAAGILADNPRIAEALLSQALDYARQQSIPELELRLPCSPCSMLHAPCQDLQQPEKVRMLLNLPKSGEDLLASFKSKLRSQVRKPIRDGLKAVLGGKELLGDFYPVFTENMRDLGSPVHSQAWIASILECYGPRARCGIVFMPDGTPAACGIILLHERTVSIPWASSLKRYNRYSPNMLLYWSFLEYAADNGNECFDFGRSTPGEGTYKFKEQWGAAPSPLHWVRIETGTGTVRPAGRQFVKHSSKSRARQGAEKVFQIMPVPLATLVGSRLRKYISL